MEGVSFENVRKEVEEIALEHGMRKYKINVKEQKFTGDNYTSKIVRAQIAEDGGEKREINLLIKLNILPQEVRDKFTTKSVFDVESNVYKVTFPSFQKYQDDYNIPEERRFTYPKHYKSGGEFMILGDLSFEGYEMYEKNKPLDYVHSETTARSLAYFHAVSFAMKSMDLEQFESLTAYLDPQYGYGPALATIGVNTLKSITPQLRSKEKGQILTDFMKTSGEVVQKCLTAESTDPFNVICHGDFHIKNVMFRYEDNKPEVLILDWQTLKYGSPAIDILEMFYTSGRAFRDKYYQKIIDEYYKTLTENLKLYGCDVEKLYPRKVLDQHLKDLLPHGILLSIVGSTINFRKPGEETGLDTMFDSSSTVFITATDEMIECLEEIADDVLEYNQLKK